MGAGVVKSSGRSSLTDLGLNCRLPSCAMSCEACSVDFNLFKRKRQCSECGHLYCSNCVVKATVGSSTRRHCGKCKLLISGNFTRKELNGLKVRDLRQFLVRREALPRNCTEKADLVEAILHLSNNIHYRKEQAENQQRLLHLQEQQQHNSLFEASSRPRAGASDNTSGHHCPPPRPQHPLFGSRRNSSEPNLYGAQTPGSDNSSSDFGCEPTAAGSSSNSIPESSVDAPATGLSRSRSSSSVESLPVSSRRGSSDGAVTDPPTQPPSFFIPPSYAEVTAEINVEDSMDWVPSEEAAAQTSATSDMRPQRASLDSVHSLEAVEELTVRQLKEILMTNFVDYKGCCEKWELLERVQRLWKSKQINKQKAEDLIANEENQAKCSQSGDAAPVPSAAEEADVCKICMDALIDCVLLECGHMITCTQCGKQLADCPICRQYISRVVRIFKA